MGLGFLSNRGIFLTWPYLSQTGTPWLWWLLAGLAAGVIAAWLRRRARTMADRAVVFCLGCSYSSLWQSSAFCLCELGSGCRIPSLMSCGAATAAHCT